MANKRHTDWRNFGGIHVGVDEREGSVFLKESQNLDSNLVKGMLVSRKGYASRLDTATDNINRIFIYRDEEQNKDVLLSYEKDGTVANRRIWLYTKTLGAAGNFSKVAEYSYGSLEFGDRLSFLLHRNGVRIGTGTGANNKALFAGYIDRSTGSSRAMFNDQISFNDFFVTKQQWVQQETLFNYPRSLVYDSTNEKYYCLTFRGIEIRDSDFYLEQILTDVKSYIDTTGKVTGGGLALSGTSLFAAGVTSDSGTNPTFKIVLYDTSDNYEKGSTEITKNTANERIRGIDTDGTNVWSIWTDGTDSFVGKYTMTLGTTADKFYTESSVVRATDITAGLTNDIYFLDSDNDEIVEVDKSSAAATAFSVGVTGQYKSITDDGTKIYYIVVDSDTKVYSTTPASPFSSSTKTLEKTLTFFYSGINIVDSDPHLLSDIEGLIRKVVSTSDFSDDGYFPGKMMLTCIFPATAYSPGGPALNQSADGTVFYGMSIVDIYGQESHLMTGSVAPYVETTWSADQAFIRMGVNADGETYNSELSTPSSDPTQANSVWNEFRKISKIRVYRAFSSDLRASEPTTNYRFLKEVDINDKQWIEATNNLYYTFTFVDNTLEDDISSVTYEESSGLPEVFKPYYTNWQYAQEFSSRFYYGNMRTDDLYTQQIIQTPIAAPDMNYQHDQNIELFSPKDGDEIKGFGESWNRLIVFKGLSTAIYNELFREKVYDVGLQAPDSVVVWNNTVFFVFNDGFYRLTPSGYDRISLAVENDPDSTYLSGESNFDQVTGAFFTRKEKIWWHFNDSKSYLYNVKEGTWDSYTIKTTIPSLSHDYVTKGIDNLIFTAGDDGQVYEHDTGSQDNGVDMAIVAETHPKELGSGYLESTFYRKFVSYLYSGTADDVTLGFKYLNKNGSFSDDTTLPQHTALKTIFYFMSGTWGQIGSFRLSGSIDAELRISSVGVEHSEVSTSRVAV